MSTLRRNFWALLVGLTLSQAVTAQSVYYTIRETDDVLVAIDLTTLNQTVIGPLGVVFEFGGLAYNPNTDTLYAVDGRGAQGLYTINRNTGAATLVGLHGVTDMFGLEYDPTTNTLYGTQFSGGSGFFTISQANGSASLIANMTNGIGSLGYDPGTDRLLGLEDGSGDFFNIDRNTGALSLLANNGFNNDSGGAYDPTTNRYYVVDWSGNFFYLDGNAGFARVNLPGLGDPFDGGAIVSASVPEPGTILLCGLAGSSALVIAWRRRKRKDTVIRRRR